MKGHKPHALDYMPLFSESAVYHYTCNSPSHSYLENKGIESVGDEFGCFDSREVLKIPREFLESEGINSEDKGLFVLEFENYLAKIRD